MFAGVLHATPGIRGACGGGRRDLIISFHFIPVGLRCLGEIGRNFRMVFLRVCVLCFSSSTGCLISDAVSQRILM